MIGFELFRQRTVVVIKLADFSLIFDGQVALILDAEVDSRHEIPGGVHDLYLTWLHIEFFQSILAQRELESVSIQPHLSVLRAPPRDIRVQAEDLPVLRLADGERRAAVVAALMEGLRRKAALAAAIKQFEKPFIGERAQDDCLGRLILEDLRFELLVGAKARDIDDEVSFLLRVDPVRSLREVLGAAGDMQGVLQGDLVHLQLLDPEDARAGEIDRHLRVLPLGDGVVLVRQVALVENIDATGAEDLEGGAEDRRAKHVRVLIKRPFPEMEPERVCRLVWLLTFMCVPGNVGVQAKYLVVGLHDG